MPKKSWIEFHTGKKMAVHLIGDERPKSTSLEHPETKKYIQ